MLVPAIVAGSNRLSQSGNRYFYHYITKLKMHRLILDLAIGYSILIAACIGVVRFRSIASQYYPFLFLVWLGTLNETLSLVLIFTVGSNTINSNIFVLPEYGLIVWQFYRWGDRHVKKYTAFAVAGLVFWIIDNLVINSLGDNNSLFRIGVCFAAVFLSIDQVNKLLFYERGPLYKNSIFIVCIAFLLYFGFKAFIEAFNLFHLQLSPQILRDLWIILYIVNGISNILFALAVLWIPTKVKFTLLY